MDKKIVETFLDINGCRIEKENVLDMDLYCYEAERKKDGKIWKLYSKSIIHNRSLDGNVISILRDQDDTYSPFIIKLKNLSDNSIFFAKQKMSFVIVDKDDEDGRQIGWWKDGILSPLTNTITPVRNTIIPSVEGRDQTNLLEDFESVNKEDEQPVLKKRKKETNSKFKKNKSKYKKSKRTLKGKKSKSKNSLKK
jgi:hypothetical protein